MLLFILSIFFIAGLEMSRNIMLSMFGQLSLEEEANPLQNNKKVAAVAVLHHFRVGFAF